MDYQDTDGQDDSPVAESQGRRREGLRSSGLPSGPSITTDHHEVDEHHHDEIQEEASPPQHPPVGRMKAMLVAYTILLLLGFSLSLLSDLSRIVPPLIKFSLGLQIASSIFFCAMVPLTHFSGSLFHKKWKFYQPFIGGTR